MPLWGTTGNTKPQFEIHDAGRNLGNVQANFANTFMDKGGISFYQPAAPGRIKKEILVAMQNGLTLGVAPSVCQFFFDTPGALDANTSGNVYLVFSEEVALTGNATPLAQINLTQTGALTSNVSATYGSGNTTAILRFSFTTPADFQGATNPVGTLTILDQGIGLGNTVVVAAVNTSISANTVVPNTAVFQSPLVGPIQKSISHANVTITGVFFASNAIVRNATSNLFIVFSGNVNEMYAPLPNVWLAGDVSGTNLKATYVAGNGTSNLQFTYNAATGGVISNINVQPLLVVFGGQINDVAANAAANLQITTAVSTAAGKVAIN